MEDVEGMVFLILGMWLFVTARRQTYFHNRLKAAKQKTAEKNRRVWEILRESSDDETSLMMSGVAQRRRERILHSWQSRRRRRPRVWAFNRATAWWDVIVPGFTHAEWLHNFRMSRETFTHLCDTLRPALERRDTNAHACCVPLDKRLAVALWKLSTGAEHGGIGHLFGVSVTTVRRCVRDFCAAAEALLVPEHICFPDQERFEEMSAYSESSWGLPQCVGAVGETRVQIMAPRGQQRCDRRSARSVVLQGVVDGGGIFWDVFAGPPGNDARVLRRSRLWESAGRGSLCPAHTRNLGGVDVGYYILGDAAYPLKSWLLKPFPDTGRLTAGQRIYNRRVAGARGAVEDALGRLKGRWRCLLKRMDGDVGLVQSMLRTCCALHNLCESHGAAYDRDWDAAEPVGPPYRGSEEEEEEEVRESLVRYLNS